MFDTFARWFEALETLLFQLSLWADTLVNGQLQHPGLLTFAIVWVAGLATSLTPCTLSMLPVTFAYLGGYSEGDRAQSLRQSGLFCLGLATTLMALGLSAAVLGRIYGQIGWGLTLASSLIAIVMGLNLLELLPLRLPGLNTTSWLQEEWPVDLRAYLLGLTFGLVASPCSTPVLATLLAWVAASGQVRLGAALLGIYTLGSVLPLLLAGLLAASLRQLLALRQWSAWLTPTSGIVLVGFGLITLLLRLPIHA
ncbi:cytochrome c biogenesis protein CcdA [Synechococcus elongatus IITB7]|uniref:cytochrome c biogenesis protein CcdA n=1 Tax=Synechococcus elongatus TaxID=32046 RepID=UPI0030D168C7